MDNDNNSLVTEITDDNVDSLGDGLFDGWDDDSIPTTEETKEEETTETEGDSAEDEDESDSTDQAEEEATDETEKPDDSETEQKPDEKDDKTSQPKTYTFTHLDDEPITLTADEMIPYVNKGLDYDRIRTERDAMKANYPKYEMYAEFLESIKGKFDSVEDLMDDTNATLLVKNEADNGRTLTKEDALAKVKANREEKFKSKVPPKSAPEETKKEEAENPKASEVKAFAKAFKKAFPNETMPKWEDLPTEVQNEFEKSGELTVPYFAWRLSQKDNEIKTIKNNQKNKERSTGSRKSTGKGKDAVDPMLVGFDDD